MDPTQAAKSLIDFHPVWGSICVLLLIAIGILWRANQNLHAEGKKELREILQVISNFNAASAANLSGLEQTNVSNEGIRRAMEEQAKATEILAAKVEFAFKALDRLGDGRSLLSSREARS